MQPRWRKVIRDLTTHRTRTLLVVLSIAVGVFAVAVVMGGREVLLREFDAISPPVCHRRPSSTPAVSTRRSPMWSPSATTRALPRRRRVTVVTRHLPEASPTAGWETLPVGVPVRPRGRASWYARSALGPLLGEVILERVR
jgi:hypothetical protein